MENISFAEYTIENEETLFQLKTENTCVSYSQEQENHPRHSCAAQEWKHEHQQNAELPNPDLNSRSSEPTIWHIIWENQ